MYVHVGDLVVGIPINLYEYIYVLYQLVWVKPSRLLTTAPTPVVHSTVVWSLMLINNK